MGEFDDEREAWWQPFQKLWHVDDKQWVAERRALWKQVKTSPVVTSITREDELRGMRTLFLTGQTFDKHYVPQNIFDIETGNRVERIRADDYERLYMLPEITPEILEAFAKSVEERRNGFYRISNIGYFQAISSFHINSGMSHDIIMSIYRHLMGGAGIKDNSRYLQSVGKKFLDKLDNQLRSYFSEIRWAIKERERDSRYLSELYDYYESVALFLCEQEDLMQERYFPKGEKDAKHRHSDWVWEANQISDAIADEGSHLKELVEKAQTLMRSEKFPATLRQVLEQ